MSQLRSPDRDTAVMAFASRRASPSSHGLVGLPGIGRLWRWLGLTDTSGRLMAHRDTNAGGSARRMAHQVRRAGYKPRASAEAVRIAFPAPPVVAAPPLGSSAGPASTSFLTTLGRRFAGPEPRRRETLAVLTLLFVASLASIVATSPSFSSPARAAAMGNRSPAPDWAGANVLNVQTWAPWSTVTPTPSPSPTPSPTAKKTATPAKTLTFVAMGDSLTAWPIRYNWPHCLDVDDQRAVMVNNAGIPGNLTSQMRARFSRDVIAYKPDFVLIMGGTNDISNEHSIPQSTVIANLKAMVVAAKRAHIKPFLLLIPPQSSSSTVARVKSLNSAIIHLANSQQIYAVDTYSPLATSSGVYKSQYTWDGLHLTYEGAQVVGATVWRRIRRLGY
jgi:lysophospholipase L1-like esterase